jgi:hypothetical protein
MQAEMAVCELRMQDPDFFFDIIFRLMPHWKKCIIMHIEK